MKKLFVMVMISAWVFSFSLYAQQAEEINPEEVTTEEDNTVAESNASDINMDVPKGLERKEKMDPQKLSDKKEGWYPTGLPLVNSNPDTGIGYGVRAYVYINGEKSNPFFKYAPYQHQFLAQYFATTNGWQYHWLGWDAPYFMNSLFRLRADLIYDKNTSANYFARGSASDDPLTHPVTGKTYDSFSDYAKDLRYVDSTTGKTYSQFNKYSYESPSFKFSVEREIMGGLFRPYAGMKIVKTSINDYTGDKVKALDSSDKEVDAIMGQTLLYNDNNDSSKITGYEGGWNSELRLGFAFDTRDYEPDPSNGLFSEIFFNMAQDGVASDFTYQRYTFSQKAYFSPVSAISAKDTPKILDPVIAMRVAYTFVEGDMPFFNQNNFEFTEGSKSGLGGLRTLRGYASNRFVGDAMSVANIELRWTMGSVNVAGQNFAFILVPFFDAGQAYDDASKTNLDHLQTGYGAGLRIAWNKATIIMADYGMSDEHSGLYIDFTHIF